MVKTYAFRNMSFVKGDPQIIGETLETLQQENGQRLTPRVVVDAARPIGSPLHGSFEWDDCRAAELHREHQARQLISSVRIIVTGDGEPTMQRAFVNVIETIDEEEQHGYVPMARVLSDADLFRQVCEQAAKDLRSWEGRYDQFTELVTIGKAARERVEQLALPAAATGLAS